MNGKEIIEGLSSATEAGRDTGALKVSRAATLGTKTPGIDAPKRNLIGCLLSGTAVALTGGVSMAFVALPADAVDRWRLATRVIWEVLKILSKVDRISRFVERIRVLFEDLSAKENIRNPEEGPSPVEEALGELPTLLDDNMVRDEITKILGEMEADDSQLKVLSSRLAFLDALSRGSQSNEILLQYETMLAAFELRRHGSGMVASIDVSSSVPQALTSSPDRDPTRPLACGFRVFSSTCGDSGAFRLLIPELTRQ